MKIIYIMGSGQSGTTLLTLLIGAHKKVVNGGELFQLLNYYYNIPDKQCTDGYALQEHPLWSKVIADLKNHPNLRADLLTRDPPVFNAAFKVMLNTIDLYTKEHYIVLSAKPRWRLEQIVQDQDLLKQLYVIHLIRDPRGKVNSKIKRKKKKRFKLGVQKSLSWNFNNWLFQRMHNRLGKRCVRVKYEELTQNSVPTLEYLMTHIGLEYQQGQERYFDFPQPLFSGNGALLRRKDPVSFRTDFLKISNTKWWLYTLLSLPMIIKFKYPIKKSGYIRSKF